jgi:hypothetical protein
MKDPAGNDMDELAWNMRALFNLFYENVGLRRIVDLAGTMFGRPVIVHDTSYRILAFSSREDAKNLSFTENAAGEHYLDARSIETIHEKKPHIVNRDENAHFFEKTNGDEGTLVCRIKIDGIETAYVAVHENGVPFSKRDCILVEHLAKILSLQLRREDTFQIDKNILPSHAFADLFAGNVFDKELVDEKYRFIPWLKTAPISLMVITNRFQSIPPSKIPFVVQAIKTFVPINHCTIHKFSVVAFLDSQMKRRLLDEENAEWTYFLNTNALYAGIGMASDTVIDLGIHYKQAKKAAELAAKYDKAVLLFEDCGLYLLSAFFQPHDLYDFTHPAVTKLMKSDRENGGELLNTLKYYIYYNNAPNEAAKILHIHRNTLFYRINKIKEMTGISFDTVEDIFKIHLSICLLEINGRIF